MVGDAIVDVGAFTGLDYATVIMYSAIRPEFSRYFRALETTYIDHFADAPHMRASFFLCECRSVRMSHPLERQICTSLGDRHSQESVPRSQHQEVQNTFQRS